MTRSLFSARPSLSLASISSLTFALFAASGSIALSSLAIPSTVYAQVPMVKTSAPAFYRVMLGKFEVTAISDGTVALPMAKLMTNTSEEKTLHALKEQHLHSPVATSVNAYLINTGSKLVLIDTGAAGLFGPTLGRLIKNMKASGYSPEQVDEVYITHMHGDHAGGLMTG